MVLPEDRISPLSDCSDTSPVPIGWMNCWQETDPTDDSGHQQKRSDKGAVSGDVR